jgi:hypothetical protein
VHVSTSNLEVHIICIRMTMFKAGTVENMNIDVVAGTGMSDFHPKTRLNMNGLPTTLQTPRVMSGSSPAHKTRGERRHCLI